MTVPAMPDTPATTPPSDDVLRRARQVAAQFYPHSPWDQSKYRSGDWDATDHVRIIAAALTAHEANARERVAAERERCAKVAEDVERREREAADSISVGGPWQERRYGESCAEEIAAAIRALPPGDVQGGE